MFNSYGIKVQSPLLGGLQFYMLNLVTNGAVLDSVKNSNRKFLFWGRRGGRGGQLFVGIFREKQEKKYFSSSTHQKHRV